MRANFQSLETFQFSIELQGLRVNMVLELGRQWFGPVFDRPARYIL